jgi:cobalamin biosynthesis Mg chelatase CobN
VAYSGECKRPSWSVCHFTLGVQLLTRHVFATFRDSFANVVDLLDDMFERAAQLDEPPEMNFIRKHSLELAEDGVKERTAARLFSNP